MPDGLRELLGKAADRRKDAGTRAHRENRRRVDVRNEKLQAAPIVRGPNAPKDGTYGGVKK